MVAFLVAITRKIKGMAKEAFVNAQRAKKDEFYTQIGDIERECSKYKAQFKDKIIFLNCDDPLESNFWRHFALNFTRYGLKKLVATHFDRVKSTYKLELTGDMNEDGSINESDIVKTPLKQNGDFRSAECIELLKQADVVVTNPPFSLFREYVAQLVEYNKKFLIIGNTNALNYKEIFELVKEDKLRTGYTNFNVGMYFYVPDDWEKYHKIENGKKLVRVSTSCWFTNLEVVKHHEKLVLYKKYDPDEYPRYYNYDAIEVSKVSDIPMDYAGQMGVPITFIDKYNPDQFEIIGKGVQLEKTIRFPGDKATLWIEKDGRPWKAPFERVIIKNKEFKT